MTANSTDLNATTTAYAPLSTSYSKWRGLRFIVLLLACSAMAGTVTTAGQAHRRDTLALDPLVGHAGGATHTLALSGNLAYVAAGPRLAVVDITDRARPVQVGQSAPLRGIVMGISLNGPYAYVATQGGFSVMDLSSPTRPLEVASYDGVGVHWVALAGNRAYLACGAGGLRILDVSIPTQPVEVGRHDTPDFAEALAVVGSLVYIADHASGLRIVSVAVPSAPFEVGFLDTPGDAWHLQVVGGRAYIADHQRGNVPNGGLRIVDVSNPAAPFDVGALILGEGAHGVAIDGTHAFLASDGGRLSIIDVTNAAAPVEVGSHPFNVPGSEALKVVLDGGDAFVPLDLGELHIVNVSDRRAPAHRGVWSQLGKPLDVALSGSRAYLAVGGRGLAIADVAGSGVSLRGRVATPGVAVSIAATNRYVLVGLGEPFNPVPPGGHTPSVRIIDAVNPDSPVEIGAIATPDQAQGIAVDGNTAYVAVQSAGLQILDISNPATPAQIRLLALPGVAEGVATSGTHAYVAAGPAGVRVIDVANPGQATEVGFIDTPGYARDLAITGGRLYVADGQAGFRILDLTDPRQPVDLGSYDTQGIALGIAAAGNTAYVSDYGRGLLRFDVANPSLPRLVSDGLPHQVFAHRVAIESPFVLAAGADGGLALGALPVEPLPVGVDDHYETAFNTPLNVPAPGVLGNDTYQGGGPLTAILVSGTTHGTLTLSPDGSFQYLPNSDFSGLDTFTYRAAATGSAVGEARAVIRVADSATPLAPTNLVATTIAADVVTLRWTVPSIGPRPTAFVLEGGLHPGSVLASIPTGSAAPTFTFRAPSGAFYLRVHALRGAIRSPASNQIRVFVNVPQAPSKPEGLLGLAAGSTLALAWTNSYAGGEPAGLILDVTGALAGSLPFPLSDRFDFPAVPAGTYTFSLRAWNATGVSEPSNPVSLTFPGVCAGAPHTPLAVAYASGSTVTIAWAPPASGPAPTSYVLTVSGSLSGALSTAARSLSGTVGAGTYVLSVAAANQCGISGASPQQTIVVS